MGYRLFAAALAVCVSFRTFGEVVELATAEEFASAMATGSGDYALVSDIDFDGVAYAIPESFLGTIDGRNHVIKNMSNVILFKSFSGKIENLKLGDSAFVTAVSADGGVGAIASTCVEGEIYNCELKNSTVTVSAWNVGGVGGFFGRVVGSCVVSNCQVVGCSVGRLSGGTSIYAGGVVGYLSTTGTLMVADCVVSSNATGNIIRGGYCGGIVGLANGSPSQTPYSLLTVLRCANFIPVRSEIGGGGIVGGQTVGNGGAATVRIYDCTNYAGVAMVDNSSANQHGVGGIFGRGHKCGVIDVRRCVNYGDLSATAVSAVAVGDGAGGVVGGLHHYNSVQYMSVSDCANYGTVEGGLLMAGGIVGQCHHSNGIGLACVSNCANYRAVSGSLAVGGIVGRYSSPSPGASIVNVFNSGSVAVAGSGDVGGVIGKILNVNGTNGGTDSIDGVCQLGAVTGVSGHVSMLIGDLSYTTGMKKPYALNVKSVILAGLASATEGGQVGLLIGGSSSSGTLKGFTVSVDANCRLATTEGVAYYDLSNVGQSIAGLVQLGANDLTNGSAAKILNDYASANPGCVSWVQTANYPELSIFAGPVPPVPTVDHGLLIFLR